MTNYEKYFSTPEKTAQTIVRLINESDDSILDAICVMFDNCSGCPCNLEDTELLLCDNVITTLGTGGFAEWLRSEVQSDE